MSNRDDGVGEIPAEKFVKTYIRAVKDGFGSEYIGKKLGISARRVNTRASKYRKIGVQLPYMPTRREKVDVNRLNNWIQEEWK